jgi:hypothetical protein
MTRQSNLCQKQLNPFDGYKKCGHALREKGTLNTENMASMECLYESQTEKYDSGEPSICLAYPPLFACNSESISSATVASLNVTLQTFKDIGRQGVITLFAPMRSSDVSPVLMLAFVPCSQVLNSLQKSTLHSRPHLSRLASNDLVRTGKQTVLVPLGTCTCLPALPACVAELAAAFASSDT